jgi:hypothetical protein
MYTVFTLSYMVLSCFLSQVLYADHLNGGMQAVLCKRNHYWLLWRLGEPISLELSNDEPTRCGAGV